MLATARDGETLDEICWRVIGRTAAVTEQSLELNPGLADLGPRLPGGTNVRLPDPPAAQFPMRETVRLWD
ncbi:phage tail protein [Altererythrobacter buctensis]|uniref:Phage tail protein n=1 Tax=Alteraurantiacibacter buctensis TaxID=1503981 RepID=A0A844Z2Y6_9SPHN|nr:tail protein X [Alteraurantiacibacter buctensis]MXO73566.1 phage tail protein [Alteraurantiacibacter buctensis]